MANTVTTSDVHDMQRWLRDERSRVEGLCRTIGDKADEVQTSTRARLEHELDEIDWALARIEDGGYGICEACGRPIDAERLRARPTARFCMHDQAEFERARVRAGGSS